MDQPDPPATPAAPFGRPQPKKGREAARQARLEREAAALRENLRRRKGQARARADEPPPPPAGATRAD